LSAEVNDPDGDPVTVSWMASAGSVTPAQGTNVTYTAPAEGEGTVDIVATADDGEDDGRVDCNISLLATEAPAPVAAVGGEGADVLEFTCPEFPLGVTDVDNRCKAVLDDVALRLRQDPRATAELVGHSDSSGSDETNAATSQERADKARDYLVETHGIDSGRISTMGVGSSQPIADNETPEGRLSNRRVAIRVIIPGE
jgi:outer membrane protein OmpA-like peptidoglycan-associated protein